MFDDYQARNYPEVITKAHSALQRFLQILVGEGKNGKGELSKLFARVKNEGLISDNLFIQQIVQKIQSFISSERANNSTAKPSTKAASSSDALLVMNFLIVFLQHCLHNTGQMEQNAGQETYPSLFRPHKSCPLYLIPDLMFCYEEKRMSNRIVYINEMVSAFDAIIPGYAWAWHDANAREFKNGGWRNSRRTRLHMEDGRCLLMYGLMFDEGVIFFNRGYLHLARVRFPCAEGAVKDIMAQIPHLRKSCVQDGESRMAWFYNDTCEFSKRAEITRSVLDYIGKNAVEVQPLWQDGNLTRSS